MANRLYFKILELKLINSTKCSRKVFKSLGLQFYKKEAHGRHSHIFLEVTDLISQWIQAHCPFNPHGRQMSSW
jgi:hypothetical protein